MVLERILALAAQRESEALEFKRTTGTRREAAATVCATLNHRGGHMLVGGFAEGKCRRPAGERLDDGGGGCRDSEDRPSGFSGGWADPCRGVSVR